MKQINNINKTNIATAIENFELAYGYFGSACKIERTKDLKEIHGEA